MNLETAIKEYNVPEVEKILKEKLKKEPRNIDLLLKLCLTELELPSEDYEKALEYIQEIYKINPMHLFAIIVEGGVRFYSFGSINEELFQKLQLVKGSQEEMAIIEYIKSWYYYAKEDFENEKNCLVHSAELCDKYPYPLKWLGLALIKEGKVEEGKRFLEKALNCVTKIYTGKEFRDFVKPETYISEFLTGTEITLANYERIKENLMKV